MAKIHEVLPCPSKDSKSYPEIVTIVYCIHKSKRKYKINKHRPKLQRSECVETG